MMRWQALQGEDMTEGDRQHLEVVGLLLTGDHLCQRETQVELAQLQLDLHLPGTGHAEEQQIRSILTCRSGWRRELLRALSHQMKACVSSSTFMACRSRILRAMGRQ